MPTIKREGCCNGLLPRGKEMLKVRRSARREDALRPLSLRFRGCDLEKEYRREIITEETRRWRFTSVVGAGMYAIFYLLDQQLLPDLLWLCLVIRFAVVCPALLLSFVLSFTGVGAKKKATIFLINGGLASLGIIAMIALAGPPANHIYYGGLLLCVLFYYLFLPGWLLPNLIAWTTFVAYEVVVFLYCDLTREFLIGSSYIFFFFNLSGMFGCYGLNRMERRAFLQRRTIKHQAQALQKALAVAEDERRLAESLAQTDPLTGAANRRSFFPLAEREWARHRRNGHSLSLLMFDIDHFKQFNDRHGHRAGDRVLRTVARSLLQTVRGTDTVCRYGGEEFAVLLPETGSEAAHALGCRILGAIEQSVVLHAGIPLGVTASLGIATAPATGMDSFDELLEQADKALYSAKKAGRNQLRRWTGTGTGTAASCEPVTKRFLEPSGFSP